MSASAWTVAIRLMMSTNASMVSGNIAKSAAGAEKSVSNLNGSLLKTSKSAEIMNKAMTGIGLTAAVAFAVGIKGAADLQSATLQSAIAMGRMGDSLDSTMGKMRDFRNVAISMSSMTGQSVADAMNVIAIMASSGLSAGQIKSDYKSIAQYTDILHFGKDKMSYEEAARLGGGLTHDMRLFNSDDSKYGLGRVAQLSYLSPHGTSALTTQIRRMAPPLEGILPGTSRQKADQITMLAAWADRMGNLPFAGSAISQMVTQMISPRSERVVKGFEDLGLYSKGHKEGKKYIPGKNLFWDSKTQQFDIMPALFQVQRAVAAGKVKKDDTAVKALFSGPQNMQRILTAFTSKEALTAYNNIKRQMKDMGSDPSAWMDKVQTQLMQTLSGQTGLLVSNFKTLTTLLTEGFIPALTGVLSTINTFLGGDPKNPKSRGALGWLADNPDAAKMGGGALAMAGIAGIVSLLSAGKNVIHFFATLGKSPHFGTIISDLPSGAKAAETVSTAARVARGVETVGFLGMIGKALTGPIGGMIKGLGSKFLPVIGELGLLYSALELLVGGFVLLNNLLGIHKQPNTPTTHDERAAGAAAFHGNAKNVSTGAKHTGAGASDHAAGAAAFRGLQTKSFGRGHGAGGTNVTVSFEYHAPVGGDEPSHRRAFLTGARKAAEQVASVMSDVARTSGRAAGALPAMSGASHYEFAGSPG